MSVTDLITQWEDALVEAQVPVSPVQELDDADLGAANVPGILAKSGLMAAGSDPCKDQYVTYFLTCLATC